MKNIPSEPGIYHWSTWEAKVRVYKKKGGKHLYVAPPRGVPVRVTHRIAGTFLQLGYDR